MNLTDVYNIIIETFELSKSYFFNSENRIFHLYLVSSLVLAFYVFTKSKVKKSFLSYVFDKRVWTSKSAINDYLIFCFNNLIKVLLIGPYLIFGLYIAFYLQENLVQSFGFPRRSLSLTQTILFYTISLTIINDFLSFIIHRAMHKIPFLWEFHKVHHSATTMNPITQYRIHPIELILNNLRGLIGFGLVTGVFDYLSNHELDTLVFMGANIFTFLFMFFGANLRHSHIKLKYPKFIEYILISPYQHQIHHSKKTKHHDKNFGSKFAFWDYIFGSLVISEQTNNVRFGLDEDQNDYKTFTGLITQPFVKVYQQFFSKIKKLFLNKT